MITADMHTHSYFSGDSREPTREMIKAAIEKGLETICLTEHNDFDYTEDGFELDVEKYKAELFGLKEEFSGKIRVLFGVELGVMKHLCKKLDLFVKNGGFDFVIASSHLVNGFDPYFPEYFSRFGAEGGMFSYFNSINENISSFSDFDVYGHLDYAARYLPEKKYSPLDFRDVIDEILKKLIAMGKGIEINTAGLSSLGFVHPHEYILSRFQELGGEIVTIGSDAHDRTRVAADFDKAQQALKTAGFSYYAVFTARKPQFIKV